MRRPMVLDDLANIDVLIREITHAGHGGTPVRLWCRVGQPKPKSALGGDSRSAQGVAHDLHRRS